MEITETACKSILTRTSGYLRPVCTHSLNPYAGCGFGRSSCGEGCYVRFNPWLTKGRTWGRFVDVKINAAEVYLKTAPAERSWAEKRSRRFSIFFSSSTDPWQPVEQKFRVSRGVLRAMISEPPDGLILQTHSVNLLDDLESIKVLSGLCDLRAHVSIEGDVERLPGLPPPPCSLEDRIRMLRELTGQGVRTVACLSPLYPLQAPERFFALLAETGIEAVVIDHFIFGDGTPDGSRTLKTKLPHAMAQMDASSVNLSYRDSVAAIARRFLPVGVSVSGFAGIYS